MVGNRAFCQLVSRTPPSHQLEEGTHDPSAPQLPAGVEWVQLDQVEYTQPGISFSSRDDETGEEQSLGRMARQMMKSGWDMTRPADMVRMEDGRLVSLDHRRLWAATRAGLTHVSARVHAAADRLDEATAKRFAIRKRGVPTGTNPRTQQPWRAGDKPANWGHAVRFRSAVQGFGRAGSLGNRGIDPGTLADSSGRRDPGFPATGSPTPPMRMQPGPFEENIDPTAGGSVIRTGGVRNNVRTGAVVKGEIAGGTVPPGSTGGGGPTVQTDIPGTRAGGTGRVRTAAPPGGQELEEGGGTDITAEEQEAIAGPGGGGQSLLGMAGQWLLKSSCQHMQEELDEGLRKRVNADIEQRLRTLSHLTIGLQTRGDAAYAQITVRYTTGQMGQNGETIRVMDLDDLRISSTARYDRDTGGGVEGIDTATETNSFPIPLHPTVISNFADELRARIAVLGASSAASEKLRRCLTTLTGMGPQVFKLSALGGDCADLLPRGTRRPR